MSTVEVAAVIAGDWRNRVQLEIAATAKFVGRKTVLLQWQLSNI